MQRSERYRTSGQLRPVCSPLGLRICLAWIIIFTVTGCVSRHAVNIPTTKITVPLELSRARSILFLPDGRIVIETIDDRIWYQTPQPERWNEILLDPDPACLRTYYSLLAMLPDGRLSLLKDCTGTWQDRSGRTFHTIPSIMAYDWRLGMLAPFPTGPLPDSGQLAWSPDMRRGLFSTIGSYSTLYWITDTTTSPVPITLTDGNRSWFLPDSDRARHEYNPSNYRNPRTVGNTGAVAWSSKGTQIAFWATMQSIGRASNPLQRLPWDMYIMEPTTLAIRHLPLRVYDAGQLEWSPDSRWLAYIAPADGLWLLDPDTGSTQRIQSGNFTSFAWAPDGQTITAIKCNSNLCGYDNQSTDIWSYDIRNLLTKER